MQPWKKATRLRVRNTDRYDLRSEVLGSIPSLDHSMEAALWYVLTGTRGGANRVRLLQALNERPRNANQLANALELDYKTVRHHLDVLIENGVVETSGDEYGSVYLPSNRARKHWETIEEIIQQVNHE